jgi:hypothetical protein
MTPTELKADEIRMAEYRAEYLCTPYRSPVAPWLNRAGEKIAQ